jgi:hypothetical protein
VIDQWKSPQTVKSIQSFLGFCNFYQRFIKNYRRIARLLNQLTYKDRPFIFDFSCQRAFKELKKQLVSASLLVHFDLNKPTQIETDVSDGVVAEVLSQQQNDEEWHPVVYFSKTMINAELNYPIYDKEMLAIVLNLLH